MITNHFPDTASQAPLRRALVGWNRDIECFSDTVGPIIRAMIRITSKDPHKVYSSRPEPAGLYLVGENIRDKFEKLRKGTAYIDKKGIIHFKPHSERKVTQHLPKDRQLIIPDSLIEHFKQKFTSAISQDLLKSQKCGKHKVDPYLNALQRFVDLVKEFQSLEALVSVGDEICIIDKPVANIGSLCSARVSKVSPDKGIEIQWPRWRQKPGYNKELKPLRGRPKNLGSLAIFPLKLVRFND